MVVAVLAARVGGVPLHGADWGSVLEIAILMALAFGVHLKSRAAAIVLLAYFVAVQVLLRAGFGMGASGVFVALLLAWLYVRGVIGTFAYHRSSVADRTTESEPELAAS